MNTDVVDFEVPYAVSKADVVDLLVLIVVSVVLLVAVAKLVATNVL